MGQEQTKSNANLLDMEDNISPAERREQRGRERAERQKRKVERNEKKVHRITTKYAQVAPQREVVDVELSGVSHSRSESLASAFDPPTRLERYFGETEAVQDSQRISLSFVSIMLLVAFWNGALYSALLSLRSMSPTTLNFYYFVILVLLRVVYGFISDSCPKKRRKPYLIFSGFAGFIVLVLAALLPYGTEATVLATFFLLWIFAGIADVVTDALIVERSIGQQHKHISLFFLSRHWSASAFEDTQAALSICERALACAPRPGTMQRLSTPIRARHTGGQDDDGACAQAQARRVGVSAHCGPR